ncbi:retinol dehydrogenase 11-like [Euwallacea similis]|uniref:retinol dehydrogenase 11-like n=1 Tax=Euwallacea similis TaxID=1736056 RepID=UPI00344D6895
MACCTSILFWGVLTAIAIKVFIKLRTGWCKSNVCLVGKTVIVTGANSGIGYEAAEDFAKRGARVILACRNEGKGKDAEERIKKATNNNNIIYKHLDLASLKSVRQFAEDINKTEKRLDILLNNAGSGFQDPAKSEDGFQLNMAGNYFGHFLLTNLLLDLLKQTENSRIVNVSSEAAKMVGSIDVNKVNAFPENERFASWEIYGKSKACNILFTIHLAEKLKGTTVTTYSLHPGVVNTNIFKTMSKWTRFIFIAIFKWVWKSSLEGAQTSIYCSVAKNIENLSGEHFENCHVVDRYNNLRDPDLPKKLWEVSTNFVNLKS